jgi:hypothetical protein
VWPAEAARHTPPAHALLVQSPLDPVPGPAQLAGMRLDQVNFPFITITTITITFFTIATILVAKGL